MMDVLQKELAGGDPITVRIRGTERVLAFSMHAVILYKQLTATAGDPKAVPPVPAYLGDSLFLRENFDKIDVRQDPERWLKCLWAGLHEFVDGKWIVAVTLEELGALVDFSNAGEISLQMAKAIAQAMPKADPAAKKDPAPAAEETLTAPAPSSTGSTSEPSADLALVAANS
jgi:hypothetical protein